MSEHMRRKPGMEARVFAPLPRTERIAYATAYRLAITVNLPPLKTWRTASA
jgi:Cu/Ag efflux pump CusA